MVESTNPPAEEKESPKKLKFALIGATGAIGKEIVDAAK